MRRSRAPSVRKVPPRTIEQPVVKCAKLDAKHSRNENTVKHNLSTPSFKSTDRIEKVQKLDSFDGITCCSLKRVDRPFTGSYSKQRSAVTSQGRTTFKAPKNTKRTVSTVTVYCLSKLKLLNVSHRKNWNQTKRPRNHERSVFFGRSSPGRNTKIMTMVVEALVYRVSY